MKPRSYNPDNNTVLQAKPELIGLILIGGESSRMGSDKSEICYYDKGQRHHMFELISASCEISFLSCNSRQSTYITDLPVIEDKFNNIGPLGGILSAFEAYPDYAILTLPCDLPFLNSETISYLISNRNPLKMATSFRNHESGVIEPLITIWEPASYRILKKYLAEGCRSPFRILTNADVKVLDAPDPLVFKNVNTRDEYSEAIKYMYPF